MTADVETADRRAATTIALMTARRSARSAALWGVLFGALIANEALSYDRAFPTIESREQFARTFGANAGLAAVTGTGRHLETIQGFVSWRVFGLLIIVGAVWGLLTATRLLRGEEDAGRWELLLAGRTTRRRATVQAIAGLGAGYLVLWGLTAVLAVAGGTRPKVGFTASAPLFYATAATASAAMFLAIGALTSQLCPTRRQANGLAAAVLGASVLIRMIADSVEGLAWMRWATPLGWVENLHPLTGSPVLPLLPIGVLVVATAGTAIVVAGRRDVGVGALARSDSATADTRLLGDPALLVVRLERWVGLAWIAGLGMLAVIFGLVARTAGASDIGDTNVEQVVGRLGGQQGGAAAWIGYEFLYIAPLLAFAAASQITTMRSEEADGHLDNLLARDLSRGRWLAGRLGFAVALVALAGLSIGIGGWIGVGSGIGLSIMLQAGLNVAAPALFVLGIGTLLYGLAPRLAAPILYGLVMWSFVVEVIGSTITTNRWLLDTSLLSHLTPVPAAALDWTAVAWLCGLGALAALAGVAAFDRRDLAAA
ncbi:MAG: hypothetical protein ACXWBN_00065 [Acidimicrobiales bacterium]